MAKLFPRVFKKIQLTESENLWQRYRTWHKSLEHNRGTRAHLRRCNSPEEVMLKSGFYQLVQKLDVVPLADRTKDGAIPWLHRQYQWQYATATLAGVSAHIDQIVQEYSFSYQLGLGKGGKPTMSELRVPAVTEMPGLGRTVYKTTACRPVVGEKSKPALFSRRYFLLAIGTERISPGAQQSPACTLGNRLLQRRLKSLGQ